ncbi:MAG: ABC transporter permease [Salinivirgaceae bacterium]
MIVNEFRIIIRKLYRQKLFSSINLLGLTLGLVFVVLTFLFAQNEFAYDKHFTNTSNTYLLACNNGRNQVMHYGQPAVFMDEIVKDVPEVTCGVRLQWSDENIKINNHRFKAVDFVYADSAFYSFLGWNLILGDPQTALCAPMSVTISEKIAKQYFKDSDIIGQVINIGNEYDFKVTGVFKDFPEQSHIKTDFIASLSSYKISTPHYFTDWGWHASGIYLKVDQKADLGKVKLKIAEYWNLKSEDRSCTGPHIKAELQPFKDIYLKTGEIMGGLSAIDYVIVFSIIATFILLISCFNFINLSIAINSKRTIETGIKKVLGANGWLFLRQVFLEMTIYLVLAFVFGYFMIKLFLPEINTLISKHLTLNLFQNYELLLFLGFLFLFVIVVCGSIPFLMLARSNTSGLLRGVTFFRRKTASLGQAQNTLRNTLVIAQFAIGILLVISTFVVNKQMRLIRQHDTGFDKEQMIVVNNHEGDQQSRYEKMRNLVKTYPEVKDITSGSGVPFYGINNWGGPKVFGDDQNQMQGCGFLSVDANYLSVIGAEFLAGRNFNVESSSDKEKVIVTEELVKALHLDNPVGTQLGDLWSNKPWEIIGVVKNIEFHTIRERDYPVVFFCQRTDLIGFHEQMILKLQSNNLTGVIDRMKKDWNEISPDYPMDFAFLNQRFNENYQDESHTAIFLNIMTAVAIILCCLGLFGLAVFHINARIKEIGIRKVNGAKISEILALLNKDFVIWVVISFVIAAPVAFYAMNSWLQNFTTKTDLTWWIFALSGIIALGIALLTVSFQTWRAASRNPVEALRYE